MLSIVLLVGVAASPARADRDLLGGLNMRSDLGTRQVRLEVGARFDHLEGTVVLDPGSAGDGKTDHDLLGTWWFAPDRFGVCAGWRTSAYKIIGDEVWHQKLVTGVLARLPSIGTERVRLTTGVEVTAEVVRHGETIDTEWFDYRSMRAVDDLINFSLFGRAEIALDF